MKKLIYPNFFVLIAVFITSPQQSFPDEPSDNGALPSGCTVITISKGDRVFFGGNYDYINPDSYYWAEPGDSSGYGVVWVGTPDNPQQGVNERMLAYDANGLPRVDVNPHAERIPVTGEYHNYIMQIMHECATVEEVITWVNSHQRYPYMHDQLHFADSTGDAVIISAGKDGEVVFTRKAPGDGFLVSTNFNVANPINGYGYPCWRYDRAREMLRQLLERNGSIAAQDVTDVMDAVHMDKGSIWTIETMVADLVNGSVYIYYFYQYDRPVVLNVRNELSNLREPGPLSKLFPEDVQKEAARRYNKARANIMTNRIVGISWPVIVFVSLILLFIFCAEYRKRFRFWLPAVLVLGPVALIAGPLAFRRCRTAVCRNATIETLGNLIPVVAASTLGLVFLILILVSGNVGWHIQIALMFGLPVILGLAFHLIFLAPYSSRSSGRFLMQRLPQVLITTCLGMGGSIFIAMPLVNMSLNFALLSPLSPIAVMTWLAIVVLGALPGGFCIFLYERWAVKREFRAWTVLAGIEGEVTTPPLRMLWWWIPIGIAILFAGLIAGIVLSK